MSFTVLQDLVTRIYVHYMAFCAVEQCVLALKRANGKFSVNVKLRHLTG